MKLTDFNESFKHYKVKHKKTRKEYKVTAMHKNSALDKAQAQHGGTAPVILEHLLVILK